MNKGDEAMLTVRIDGLDALKRSLNDMGAKQVPFAAARAIAETAKSVERRFQSDMAGAFKSASPYVKRSTFSTSAKKTDLNAMVGLKDMKPAGGTAPAVLLKEHFTGGLRGNKPFEKALIAMGVMPGGYRAIPGSGMKLNAYGNPSRESIRRVLEVVKTGQLYDGSVNTVNSRSRGRQKNQADVSYFLKKVGDNSSRARHLDPGVYRRIGAGRGKLGAAIPVLVFVKAAAYQKVMDMKRSADEVVAREFNPNFDAAFTEALRTAR